MKIEDWLSPLLIGIIAAAFLNLLTPLFPSILFFLFVTGILLFFIFNSIRLKVEILQLRVLFLGASVTSILFALHTYFFSIISVGLVQIPLDSITGLFRSILTISLFSLLERLTKFLEDKREKRARESNNLRCTQPDYVI
jgi:hypothetical protein